MHIKRFFIPVGVFLFLLLLPVSAEAQAVCLKRNLMISQLKRMYKEEQIVVARVTTLVGEKILLEVFASPGGETWTILATKANGISCAFVEGGSWIRMKMPVEGNPT